MARKGFGLSMATITDYVPDFEPAPRGYVGKHRKATRSRVVLSPPTLPADSDIRLLWRGIDWRTVQAYAVTIPMTIGLMALILLATHSMET